MLSRIYLLAGALCVSSYALAVTPSPSIGSATARGELRIDNQEVQGSGTVFDGSVVETGKSISSGADLRLVNKTEITLLRDSLGTLYSDRFMLQRGSAQLGSTASFRVLASGMVVVPTEAHSSGIVTIDPANSVTVETKNGTLEIRNSSGSSVALVRAGHALTFSSLADKSPAEFSATGTVTSENGRYYLNSAETCMKYEVKGDNLQDYNGTSVVASGVLQSATPAAGVAGLLLASSLQPSSAITPAGQEPRFRAVIRGISISTGSIAKPETACIPDVDCCPGVPSPKCCVQLPPSQCNKSN
jgi:hypothetical protein